MKPGDRTVSSAAPQSIRLLLAIAAGLFLGLGMLALVGLFARVLALIFLAISIAAALAPVVNWLDRRIPRTLSILLVYITLFVLLIGIIALIVPVLVSQAEELFESLPQTLERLREWIQQQGLASSDRLFETVVAQLQTIGTRLLSVPLSVMSWLVDMVLVVTLSVYMLFEKGAVQQFVLSLFPSSRREYVRAVSAEMLEAAGGFIRGLAINIVFIGTVTSIGLAIIGVEFALLLGILAGLFEIIPVIGSLFAAVPAVLIALTQSPVTALITAVFFLIVQQFEGNILTPNVMHSQANVSPLLVLIAVFAGGAIGGIVGALVAIPLVAALRVFVIRVVAPAIRSFGRDVDTPTQEPEAPEM